MAVLTGRRCLRPHGYCGRGPPCDDPHQCLQLGLQDVRSVSFAASIQPITRTLATHVKADSEGWDPTNPFETEKILGEHLRGVRLVGELDLSQEQGIFAMAQSVVLGATRATGDYRRLNRYPAATAVFLAAEGTRAYDEGTFWPNLELKANRAQPMFGPHDRSLNASDQSRIGRAFLNAVQELQLESFEGIGESERWLTYVTPILLHGGIPSAYAEKAAALVLQGMREGLDEASELIERLLRPGRASQLPKPLERFLVYGGDFAVDLVQRMMALALDAAVVGGEVARNLIAEMAEDAGLPRYLAEALLNGSPLPPVIRPRTPRPWIYIDPYSCHGPFITFPPVLGMSSGSWVLTGSASSRIPASQHDSRDVPLTPFREWGVALEYGDLRCETTFGGLRNAAAYLFDRDGRLTRRQRHLKWPSALVLAANETQLLDESGSPVPLAEELPPRAGAWTGWKLLRVDTSETRAVRLVSDAPGTLGPVQVPVRKPPPAPSIATVPIPGVTGPDGCPVYSDPPTVREADATDVRSWRVRWRSDGDAGPPPTAFLDSLPERSEGRDLSPRLPDRAAFAGIIEIVGPLGSDMRERIAVVRGLTVKALDRVVGPDEKVTATVSAPCRLEPAEDSSSGSLALTFGPGQDTAALIADGVSLMLTIPRLAWAVQRRDGMARTIVGELQHIGLDEIESGEVETLIVRCGRPAEIRLELWRGKDRLQEATPKRASGDQGRWAFPLDQFRTTATNSGFATMRLVLHADGTSADVAVIQARHEVSDLKIESLADGLGQAVLQAMWSENRPFRNRLLRLWSQHRPWEAPVVADIPDDASGCVDALIETAPGPYVAEIAVGDWSNPLRPSEGSENCVHVRIGTGADEHARLATLRAANPLDALELIISGRVRPPLPEGVSVVGMRDELAQALVACCDDSSTGRRAFDGLVELALSVEGLFANLLVEDLRWSVPEHSFRKLMLYLVPVILDRRPAAHSETLRRLWQAAPLAGAAFDLACDEDGKSRWKRFAGWIPGSDVFGPEQPDQPVSKPLDEWCPDRLRNLAAAIPPMGSLPLQFGGYTDAAFEMLARSWPDRGQINGWRSAHTRVCTYTQRLGQEQHRQLEHLRPLDGSPGWHKFPADVLAASFQLVDEFGSDDRGAAARALMESYDIAPRLTERSVLLAIAMRITSIHANESAR